MDQWRKDSPLTSLTAGQAGSGSGRKIEWIYSLKGCDTFALGHAPMQEIHIIFSSEGASEKLMRKKIP